MLSSEGSIAIAPGILRNGPLAPWLDAETLIDLAVEEDSLKGDQGALFAGYLLQDCADYRGAIQSWFARLRVGGHLIVVVPHAFLYERQDALPSRLHPGQARLYTPRALLQEVEEALIPNSYRVRWLGDLDDGYDYAADRSQPPAGRHDVALVIERIAPPAWGLGTAPPATQAAPDFAFEPVRTRAEALAHPAIHRILALKLDHLGDFIMGVPALEKLRAAFPAAHLTLVVGSWNETLARDLHLADEVLVFDAFPRNATETAVDVAGRAAAFDARIDGSYDLAIDLRTDVQTRPLLRNVKAGLKAGLGNRGQYPFLDIFLPADPAAEAYDHAWSVDVPLAEFYGRSDFDHSRFRIAAASAEGHAALIWGPYRHLLPGDYLFQPAIEIDRRAPGLLAWDIGYQGQRVAYGQFDAADDPWIPFTIPDPGGVIETRLFAVPDAPILPFRFYGGRLVKRGAAATLHQSEYLALLVELVALRVGAMGVFGEP